MKNKILVIFCISLIFLSFISLVYAEDSPTPSYNFFTDIAHRLQKVGLFTSIGSDRKCSTTPDDFQHVGINPVGDNILISRSSLISKCSSLGKPSGLINTYGPSGYVGEWDITRFTNFNVPNSGSYELYCCPYRACSSNSDCSNPPASDYGSTCTTSNGACIGTSPTWSTPLYNCVNGAWQSAGTKSYTQERFCSNGINYNNYATSPFTTGGCYTSPPNWCTTPTCKTNSQSCTENSQCCSGLTCQNFGCYTSSSSSSSSGGGCTPSCGDTSTKCGPYSNGCSGGENSCTGTKTDCEVIPTTENVIVSNIQLPSGGFVSRPNTFKVHLENTGTETETVYVEAGFYTQSYAKEADILSAFPLFSAIPVANCNPTEEFLKTKEITLTPGEKQDVEIEQTPMYAYVTLGVNDYILKQTPLVSFLGVYKKCLGGYIGSQINPNWLLTSDKYFKGSITCGGIVYGKIDGKGTLSITKDYHSCVTKEWMGINETFTDDGDGNETIVEYIATQLSLTSQDLSEVTSETIMQSTCSLDSNCLPYEDLNGNTNYSVKCKSTAIIKSKIDTAAKEVCKGGVLSYANFQTITGTTIGICAVSGIIGLVTAPTVVSTAAAVGICASAIAGGVAVGGVKMALVSGCEIHKRDAAQGLCIAIPTNQTIWDQLALLDINGDGVKDSTDVIFEVIILIGGIIIIKMFAG